jgi:hypothetical protein
MLIRHAFPTAALLTTGLLLAACGQKTEEPAAVQEAPEAAARMIETAAPSLPRTASPPGARVFFVAPADGDTVANPVRIEFGLEGMSVVAAGDNTPHSGHHHLIIDAGLPDAGMPIPANDNYIHFGDGSTATEVTLEPGQHTLQLLLGDHTHIPHDPPVVSETITITVE